MILIILFCITILGIFLFLRYYDNKKNQSHNPEINCPEKACASNERCLIEYKTIESIYPQDINIVDLDQYGYDISGTFKLIGSPGTGCSGYFSILKDGLDFNVIYSGKEYINDPSLYHIEFKITGWGNKLKEPDPKNYTLEAKNVVINGEERYVPKCVPTIF